LTTQRITALLMAVLIVAPVVQAGATLDRVRRTHVLNDVLLNTYPPFGFIDSSNQLAGFDVDVAKAFAAKLGVTLRLGTPAWDSIVGGHWQGRWDICICSLSPTDARARVLSFPIRYYSSPAVLTVHQREQHITSVADISGKRVGVGLGSSYESYASRALVIPGAPPITYPFHDVIVVPGDETINFRNLALGPGVRLDAVISDLATAQAAVASTHVLRIVGPPLYAEPNVIATERGDPEWDRTVADTIRSLRADGTLTRISQKWFGQDITANEP
jgi:polar amino acid transport system substrate-binding protein